MNVKHEEIIQTLNPLILYFIITYVPRKITGKVYKGTRVLVVYVGSPEIIKLIINDHIRLV